MKRSFDIHLRKRPQVFNLFSSFPVAMYVSKMWHKIFIDANRCVASILDFEYVSELYHDIHIVAMDMIAYMGITMLVKDYDAQNKMVYEHDEMNMKVIEMDMIEV